MDKRFKHTLVASKICPYCIKVLTFMYHKNLRFEVKFIEISNKPDWFLKISPLARVPILIIGEEVVLFESSAILEYIDENSPQPLMPKDPIQKAIDRGKAEFANEVIKNLYGFIFSIEQDKFMKQKQWLKEHFKKLDQWLEEKNYMGGDQLSLVDFNYVPIFVALNMLKPIMPCDMLKEFKRLQIYGENIMGLQATKCGRVPDYEFLMIEGIKKQQTALAKFNPNYFGIKNETCCFFRK